MEVHSTIYDSKILNLWTSKPCLEIIHGLLVHVFDKYPNPNSLDLQPDTLRVICKMPFFTKAKTVQKRKEQVTYFGEQLKSSKQLNALKLFSLITSEIFQLTHRYRYQFVREIMADM